MIDVLVSVLAIAAISVPVLIGIGVVISVWVNRDDEVDR